MSRKMKVELWTLFWVVLFLGIGAVVLMMPNAKDVILLSIIGMLIGLFVSLVGLIVAMWVD